MHRALYKRVFAQIRSSNRQVIFTRSTHLYIAYAPSHLSHPHSYPRWPSRYTPIDLRLLDHSFLLKTALRYNMSRNYMRSYTLVINARFVLYSEFERLHAVGVPAVFLDRRPGDRRSVLRLAATSETEVAE